MEQPHLRQRPVPLSASESQNSQPRQVSSRVASVSESVVEKPPRTKLAMELPIDFAISVEDGYSTTGEATLIFGWGIAGGGMLISIEFMWLIKAHLL